MKRKEISVGKHSGAYVLVFERKISKDSNETEILADLAFFDGNRTKNEVLAFIKALQHAV